MQFIPNNTLLQYLDTSLILVVKDIPSILSFTAFHELQLRRNGIEVIVISQSTLQDNDIHVLIDAFPKINWVLLCNGDTTLMDMTHAINAGIDNASGKYIFVGDVGMYFRSDVIYQLRYLLHHYPNSFASIDMEGNFPCMMVDKSVLKDAGGWPHASSGEEAVRKLWYSLEVFGLSGMITTQAEVILKGEQEYILSDFRPLISLRYHWRNNKSSKYRKELLGIFPTYELKDDDELFECHYPVICLIQVRNEIKHLPEVIEHVGAYCDGIILLDDESIDGSYEAAVGDKLLLKVRKMNKGYFDDLENRNLLLQLGHLFKCDAMFFLDADERLDPKYADLRSQITENKPDAILFYVVHLWNNEEDYRVDVPISLNGILVRYRLFTNMGYMQILGDKLLHFPAVPYIIRTKKSPVAILLHHYGLMDESTRKRKFQNYNQQDDGGKMQGHDYAYLLDEKILTAKVSEIVLPYTAK